MTRVLVVVSRFNEAVTRRLLDGARAALAAGGVAADDVQVVWVPGAFELPLAVHAGLATGRFDCAVALGAVIRGETYHFDVIAGEATRGLGAAAIEFQAPVGFGLLTCDTTEQAMARAGGAAGNKGGEAAEAALAALAALQDLDPDAAT
jgi:6,7-dimethyl-8-ribityllumazine synthase